MDASKRLTLLVEQLQHALVAASATGTVYLRCTPEEMEAAIAGGTWRTYLHDASSDRWAMDIYRVAAGEAHVEAVRHREMTDSELASLADEPVKTSAHRSAFR